MVALLPEAQFVETFLLNQINFQTALASKASRVANAAGSDRPVVNLGIRRMHGPDAVLKSTRAFSLADVKATSNVLVGSVYGVPLSGTLVHSYIQVHDA